MKMINPAAQALVKEYEREIDKLVYELYGLTEEEIRVVEGKGNTEYWILNTEKQKQRTEDREQKSNKAAGR